MEELDGVKLLLAMQYSRGRESRLTMYVEWWDASQTRLRRPTGDLSAPWYGYFSSRLDNSSPETLSNWFIEDSDNVVADWTAWRCAADSSQVVVVFVMRNYNTGP